jgi:membrane protein
MGDFFSGIARRFNNFWARFIQVSGFGMAASISFSTIISLVPIFTLSLALISSLKFFSGVQDQLKDLLFRVFIPQQAQILEGYIEDFSRNMVSLNTISIVSFMLTGVFLLITVENSLNRIWEVKKSRGIMRSVITYWTVLTLGPMLIGASIWLTGRYTHMVSGETRRALYLFLTFFSSFLLYGFLLFIMYRLMPNRRVKSTPAFVGAITAALLIEALRSVFSAYIHRMAYYKIYGSIAILPALLVWLYAIWFIFVIGALVSYYVQFPRRLRDPEMPEERRFQAALSLLLLVVKGYLSDRRVRFADLAAAHPWMAHRWLEDLLEDLEKRELIIRHDVRGYIPWTEPAKANAADVIIKLAGISAETTGWTSMEGVRSRLDAALHGEFVEDLAKLSHQYQTAEEE